ncbi:MAG: SAVED domain-containing protein [Stenomitos rutilans HA7619-LM2]|jgi:nucleoside phosphorylase|nr:SAVED domain-containing protein [Stenomitos rutilans HA7619-LM2]
MQAHLVDFAIVTALKIERDAVLSRLNEYEVIKEDFEPQVYYHGYVSIPGTSERYTVVVTLLLDMGNDEAATATTRLLQRWQPANLLMVGIAGGVRDKADLGDVVVAKFVFYYEPAKLTLAGEQHRPEQFPTDTLLRSRAYFYEATEWKSRIAVIRPGSPQVDNALPNVHFEPIASGEKVIADLEMLPKLLQACPKLVAVAMEGAGVARAARSHNAPPRFLEIRGICDFADPDKNDDWHCYAANAAAAFTIGLLHDRPLPPLITEQPLAKKSEKPLLIISVQSLPNRVIAPDEILSGLDDDLKGRAKESVSLDFTSLVKGGVFTDPARAVQQLTDPQGAFATAIARSQEHELIFHGLAHIPLLVLMGHLVSDRVPVRFFDFHPSPGSNTWVWPNKGQNFPPMEVYGLPGSRSWQAKDVVLRVSVSYKVLSDQALTVVSSGAIEIDLTVVPEPVRGAVQSEEQVREYGRIFRRTLDWIAQNLPAGQRVHLFYAGPVALAFHLGQQISENIHPPVTVWNYHRGYDWAIDLEKAYIGEECIVQLPSGYD